MQVKTPTMGLGQPSTLAQLTMKVYHTLLHTCQETRHILYQCGRNFHIQSVVTTDMETILIQLF